MSDGDKSVGSATDNASWLAYLKGLGIEAGFHCDFDSRTGAPAFAGPISGSTTDGSGYSQGGQHPTTFPYGAYVKVRWMFGDGDVKGGLMVKPLDYSYAVNNRFGSNSEDAQLFEFGVGGSVSWQALSWLAIGSDFYWNIGITRVGSHGPNNANIEQAGSTGFAPMGAGTNGFANGISIEPYVHLGTENVGAALGLGFNSLFSSHWTEGDRSYREWNTMIKGTFRLGVYGSF